MVPTGRSRLLTASFCSSASAPGPRTSYLENERHVDQRDALAHRAMLVADRVERGGRARTTACRPAGVPGGANQFGRSQPNLLP